MRQRKINTTNQNNNNPYNNQQQQTQVQYQSHATENRLEEAQDAERTLVQLSTMFSKMSNLISIQNENISKIEDDVEMAHNDVTLGSEEIQKLFGMTKGNRALIIKVFGILILLIIFLRLY